MLRPGEASYAARGYSFAYRHLLWPAWERLARGRTTAQHLMLLETMQWCSPEVIERYQLHALRALKQVRELAWSLRDKLHVMNTELELSRGETPAAQEIPQ